MHYHRMRPGGHEDAARTTKLPFAGAPISHWPIAANMRKMAWPSSFSMLECGNQRMDRCRLGPRREPLQLNTEAAIRPAGRGRSQSRLTSWLSRARVGIASFVDPLSSCSPLLHLHLSIHQPRVRRLLDSDISWSALARRRRAPFQQFESATAANSDLRQGSQPDC